MAASLAFAAGLIRRAVLLPLAGLLPRCLAQRARAAAAILARPAALIARRGAEPPLFIEEAPKIRANSFWREPILSWMLAASRSAFGDKFINEFIYPNYLAGLM